MERFSAIVSIEQIANNTKAKANNANTTKSTCQWLRVCVCWAKLRNKEQEVERLEPSRLDKILQQFWALKKKDGTDYESSSLANVQAALDRRLREVGDMYLLLTSRHFLISGIRLDGKARFLREQGKGKRPNQSCSLWWLFTLLFCLRGRQMGSLKLGRVDFVKNIQSKYQKIDV